MKTTLTTILVIFYGFTCQAQGFANLVPASTTKDIISTSSKAIKHLPIKFDIKLTEIWCNKTTDAAGPGGSINSHDEVYFFMNGAKWDRANKQIKTYSARLPYGTTWSFLSKHGPAEQSLRTMYGEFIPISDTLNEGDEIHVIFTFMEEDNGRVAADRIQKYIDKAKEQGSSDPRVDYAIKLSEKINEFIRSNEDDFLGSISLRLQNNEGELSIKWDIGDNTIDQGKSDFGRRFDFYPGGSGYNYWTQWDIVTK